MIDIFDTFDTSDFDELPKHVHKRLKYKRVRKLEALSQSLLDLFAIAGRPILADQLFLAYHRVNKDKSITSRQVSTALTSLARCGLVRKVEKTTSCKYLWEITEKGRERASNL